MFLVQGDIEVIIDDEGQDGATDGASPDIQTYPNEVRYPIWIDVFLISLILALTFTVFLVQGDVEAIINDGDMGEVSSDAQLHHDQVINPI